MQANGSDLIAICILLLDVGRGCAFREEIRASEFMAEMISRRDAYGAKA
jgi:hypothetical protein